MNLWDPSGSALGGPARRTARTVDEAIVPVAEVNHAADRTAIVDEVALSGNRSSIGARTGFEQLSVTGSGLLMLTLDQS